MPIPPMPPMPGAGGPGASFLGASTITASLVITRELTLAASTRAVRTTLRGSITPACTMSTYSPVAALYPSAASSPSSSFPTITAPSTPALSAMVLDGTCSAFWMIWTPTFWSNVSTSRSASFLEAYSRAQPPPGTMPSSTAARVAFRASVTRSFFSPTSTSLAPPIFSTATPPESFARRSCSFSLSYSEEDCSTASRIWSHRSSMSAFSPEPSRMMVSSFDTVIFFASPSASSPTFSSLCPRSSETTEAPVSTAMSCRLALRLSPNPGAFTAQIFTPARSLLTMSVARASLSTSSAMISSGRWVFSTASSTGSRLCRPEIFFSNTSTYAFSSSHFIVLLLVTKYGEM
mmetsp:Transcript_70/g.185  ORF Transcript_70/g.185 Transcript_70/m.185 type:complete len:348 (-) Transcript_70:698-1741(-)